MNVRFAGKVRNWVPFVVEGEGGVVVRAVVVAPTRPQKCGGARQRDRRVHGRR